MDEERVSAEEMTEQETSDFEEAFNEADNVEGTGEEAKEETDGQKGEEEAPEDGSEEKTEETAEEEKLQAIIVNGREYTQEEIAQKLSEPPQRYGILEKLAGEAGMSVDDYLADVDERYTQSQVESRAEQLMEQGLDENFAMHVAEVEVENAKMKTGVEQALQAEGRQKETQAQAEARMQSEIAEFDRIYPGVKEFPPEVLAEIQQTGHSPVVAYQNYLLKKQASELKALKQARRNKDTLPGPAKGTEAGKADEFTEGFSMGMKY